MNKILPLMLLMVWLIGCSDSGIRDLETYVSETTAKPRGRIPPLPEFKAYSAFAYSASALRSPFESPIEFAESTLSQQSLVEPPDTNRRKDPLERFTIGELFFVGTISKGSVGGLQALVKTSSGSVITAVEGNYIGKNHGKIMTISDSKIEVIETVKNGSGGWISRPQTLGLKESGGVH